MKQCILLLSLMFPMGAMAHDWNQFKWLDTLLRNHLKIMDCWKVVNDEDMVTFRDKCSLWSMGSTENKVMAQYWAARAQHPDLNRLEFFALHFPEASDNALWQISQNMTLIYKAHAIIIGMHIAEGLTRNDK